VRALAVLVVIVTACGAPAPTASSDAGRDGGTLVVGWQEPGTLNPLYTTGAQTSALVSAITLEGLLGVDPDGAFVPALSESVPTVENGGVVLDGAGGMAVRYLLRGGVRWSDGAPFTSADVRFTWELILRDPKVTTRDGYDQIDALETPDERTVILRYRRIYVPYLSRFPAILPRHALDGVADVARADFSRVPIGTGPFRVVENVAGDHLTAERNPHYRVPGRPRLGRVIIRFIGSIDAALAQLKAGETHVAPSVGEAEAADLAAAGMTLVTATSPIVEAVAFNLARPGAEPDQPHPVLADRAVRRALVQATPKALIAASLLRGTVIPGRSEIPIGPLAAGLTQDEHDPAAARRALDLAGWRVGPDGIRAKGGTRASLRLVGTTGNRTREQVQQVLVDAWRDVGIEAKIRNVPPSVLTGSWASGGVRQRGDFDALIAQLGLGTTGDVDPHAYLARRHRCDAIPRTSNGGAGANYERFCDPRVDRLLDAAGKTPSIQGRREAYVQVLRILNEEAIAIWLYDRMRIDALRPEVAGHAANPWAQTTWDVAEWYLRR